MAKSQQSFNKKERDKKRRKKKQDKADRREQRKLEKANSTKKSFEEQLSYIDEFGNITSTPPDPTKKTVIKAEDIVLGVPPKIDEPIETVRTGTVKFMNHDKGYGFIIDAMTKDSIFFHVNNTLEDVKEGQKVNFEVEMGPKGQNAVQVQNFKEKVIVEPVVEAETEEGKEEVKEEVKEDGKEEEAPQTEETDSKEPT